MGILDMATPPISVMLQSSTSIGFVNRFSLFFIFLKGCLRNWLNSFRKACIIILAISYLNNKQGENLDLIKIWKIVKICVQNQWKYSSVTSHLSAELPISRTSIVGHYTDLVKLWKFITLEPFIRFCSNFHNFFL